MHLREAIVFFFPFFILSFFFSRSRFLHSFQRFCVNFRCTTTRWKFTVTLMMNIFDLRYTLCERDKNDSVSRSFYAGARHPHSLPVAHEWKKKTTTQKSLWLRPLTHGFRFIYFFPSTTRDEMKNCRNVCIAGARLARIRCCNSQVKVVCALCELWARYTCSGVCYWVNCTFIFQIDSLHAKTCAASALVFLVSISP